MKINTLFYMVAATSVISACVATQDYRVISTREQYVSTVAGRSVNLGNQSSTTTYENGTMTGVVGDREIKGRWSWEEGKFCREGMIGTRALERDCQRLEVAGDRLKMTSGDGSATVFDLK